MSTWNEKKQLNKQLDFPLEDTVEVIAEEVTKTDANWCSENQSDTDAIAESMLKKWGWNAEGTSWNADAKLWYFIAWTLVDELKI
jgi:hypothetical protein